MSLWDELHADAPFTLSAKAKWTFCTLATSVIPASDLAFVVIVCPFSVLRVMVLRMWLARTPKEALPAPLYIECFIIDILIYRNCSTRVNLAANPPCVDVPGATWRGMLATYMARAGRIADTRSDWGTRRHMAIQNCHHPGTASYSFAMGVRTKSKLHARRRSAASLRLGSRIVASHGAAKACQGAQKQDNRSSPRPSGTQIRGFTGEHFFPPQARIRLL